MSKVWLVLDVSYLCWRAYHTTGKLSHDGGPTGVLYGFFRGLKLLAEQFASHQFVFCFDQGKGKRQDIYPGYKEKRRIENLTEEQVAAKMQMRRQIQLLQANYLFRCGFENVFFQDGYEADDVIASVCNCTDKKDEVVIVSADKDLYQLLSPRVCMWDPYKKVAMTDGHFEEETGLTPNYWPGIKALAGCPTDNIPGCIGVGEKTAIKFFRNPKELSTKLLDKCVEFGHSEDYARNCILVELPLEGCHDFVPKEQDPISLGGWNRVMKSLGMKSLLNQVPNYAGFGLKRRK